MYYFDTMLFFLFLHLYCNKQQRQQHFYNRFMLLTAILYFYIVCPNIDQRSRQRCFELAIDSL